MNQRQNIPWISGLPAFFFAFLLLVVTVSFKPLGAKEGNIPVGEMLSKGDVSLEVKENVWRRVETPSFPVFTGTKIKTGKGTAFLTVMNKVQIEVAPDSVLSYADQYRAELGQGTVGFRFPAKTPMSFVAGGLWISSSSSQQGRDRDYEDCSRNEEIIGTIIFQPDRSVTITSQAGKLTVLEQGKVFVANVPSKESVMISHSAGPAKTRLVSASTGPQEGASFSKISSQRLEDIEQYLKDFSKTLKGKKIPRDLNATKFFALLDPIHPDKEAIRKVKSYPVRAEASEGSYVLILCDRDYEYVIMQDFGKDTDTVEEPYWRWDRACCCPDGVFRLGGYADVAGILWAQGMLAPIVVNIDDEDKKPICP